MRHLLRLEAGFGFPMRVAVVDLQVHLGLRALRWAGALAKPQIVANSILTNSKSFQRLREKYVVLNPGGSLQVGAFGQGRSARGRSGSMRGGSPNGGDQT